MFFIFTPFREDSHFDGCTFFKGGWFNHQLENTKYIPGGSCSSRVVDRKTKDWPLVCAQTSLYRTILLDAPLAAKLMFGKRYLLKVKGGWTMQGFEALIV